MERDGTSWRTPRKRPHFFEIYSSAISSKRLKIPDKFVEHMEGRTSGLVLLEGPSGNTWHAELIQDNDELFFNSGWPSFVRDHSIESGDLLVLRHEGDLYFSVQVFDQSACEKEAAFHARCSQDPISLKQNKDRNRENCSNMSYEGIPHRIRGSTYPGLQKCADKNHELIHYVPSGGCDQKEDGVTIAKHQSTSFLNENSILPDEAVVYDDLPDIRNRFSKGDSLSLSTSSPMLRSLSAEERKVARSFTSRFPYFVRIMKKFNVSGSYTLNIPYQFSMEHLPKYKITIVLRNLKGECWTVNSVPTTRVHTSHTLCGGWMAFVRANGIELDDICVFELVHKCEMQVHILGHGQGGPECLNLKKVSNGLSFGSSGSSQEGRENVLRKKKRKSTKVSSQVIKKMKRLDRKGFKILQESASTDMKRYANSSMGSINAVKCLQTKTSNGKSGVNGKAIVAALRSQGTDTLSTMLSPHEEGIARSFTSSFPKFVRVMKRFNISGSYTLKIPHQFSMAHLPNYKTEVILQNLKGESWTVNSVPDSMGRMSHTFCGGWLSFVRDNGIKVGDTCIFELVDKFVMRVHISEDWKKDHQIGQLAVVEVPVAVSL